MSNGITQKAQNDKKQVNTIVRSGECRREGTRGLKQDQVIGGVEGKTGCECKGILSIADVAKHLSRVMLSLWTSSEGERA